MARRQSAGKLRRENRKIEARLAEQRNQKGAEEMSRYVLTADVLVPASGYGQPERRLKKHDVVELSASEVTTIGAGNLRSPTQHDVSGEGSAVSNWAVMPPPDPDELGLDALALVQARLDGDGAAGYGR
jgi:hypothetical protein